MPLELAFSPCPNDTFVFHAWVHGTVHGAPPVTVTYADIDVTNSAAQVGIFDVAKVSYAALPWILDHYALLPSGGALGRGCGPLVLVRDIRADLDGATVAVPSERSTAYLLLRLWAAGQSPASVEVVPFAQIMPAVRAGRYDAGLVIHEARFTYPDFGLQALVDLGEWWEADTGLPIPLGAIVARRRLDAAALTATIRASVEQAWRDPAASADYVATHAAELSPEVQKQHIALYVNEFTRDLGDEGYAAAETLLGRAYRVGLTPSSPILREPAARPQRAASAPMRTERPAGLPGRNPKKGRAMFENSKAFSGFAVNDLAAARRFYGETLDIRTSEENGLLTLHLAGDRDVLVYPKDDHVPATYTILNFPVEEIDKAVDELTARGVRLERYDGFDQDERGISRNLQGPPIGWFTDPSGNILSVLQPS